jgi:hypothetical protein
MQVPAHILARGQDSALAKSITGGITAGDFGPRISIKGSRFRIVENGEETVLNTVELDVVVVGANPRLSKAYYAKAWDPNDVGAPDCSSLGGIAPGEDSPSPQSDLCATCPHNQWGSKVGPQGQKLKACADMKRLAVVSPEDLEGPIYLLQVTPAALKGLDAFQKALSSRGIAPEVVLTRLTFDTQASFPKLQFGLGGFLDEDQINIVDQIIAGDLVKKVTGEEDPNLIQATVVTTKPKAGLSKPSVKAAPTPVAEEVAEEEQAPEPAPAAPKRGFGKVAAAAPVAAKPAPKPVAAKPKPAPKVVPAVQTDGPSIEDEIANMIGQEGADDAGE